MKAIRDPVHGYVNVDGPALEILDTPQMQRLRRVKQLGVANLVYPGANHTRFEHSLGTYHIARKLCKQLGVTEAEVPVAALLHDVAHGPLSHVTEGLMKKYLRRDHAHRVADVLRQPELAEVLKRHGMDARLIASTVEGEGRHGQLVCGELDVDRMDYLARDAHYTGVGFGLADHEQLLRSLIFHEGRLVVGERGLHAAESVMVARFLMRPTVYYHHVNRIAESMLSRAIQTYIDDGGASPQDVLSMDDYQFTVALHAAEGYAGEMMDRLLRRNLFKRALYRSLRSMTPDLLKQGLKPQRLEKEIAGDAGVPQEYILVDVPPLPDDAEIKTMVLRNGSLVPLERVSPLVAILHKSQVDNLFFGVYTPREHVDAVRKSCEDIIGFAPVQEQSYITSDGDWEKNDHEPDAGG